MTSPRRSTRLAPPRTPNWCRQAKRAAVYAADGCACIYCGVPVAPGDARGVSPAGIALATLDHLIPVSAGGSNETANLVTACVSCNARKADASLPEHLAATSRGRVTLALLVAIGGGL